MVPEPAPVASPELAAALFTGDTTKIDALFQLMVTQNCSDLHLSTGSPPQFFNTLPSASRCEQ